MKIELIVIGKTSENYLKIGIQDYLSKISRFCSVSINVLKPHTNKSLSTNEIIKLEAKSIFQVIKPKDFLICLDLNGEKINSLELSKEIGNLTNTGRRDLKFLIGGPYGISVDVKKRSNKMISLSAMTFSHQLVRLIFLEQLYRSFSILNNFPYHK